MKKLILFISLASLFVLSSVPAFAQETGAPSGAASDQYGPGEQMLNEVAEDAVEDFVQNGGDANGAAAYEAALNAVREAGADGETAERVATKAVADVSSPSESAGSPGSSGQSEAPEQSGASGEESETAEEVGITELPDTGGAMVLGLGVLVIGAGILVRRMLI